MRTISILTAIFLSCVATAKTANTKAPPRDKSVSELRQDLERETDSKEKFYILSNLVRKYASAPLTPDMKDNARTSAESLLAVSNDYKDNWNYGNSIHHSHLVLGRLYLLEKKTGEAKRELKLAAQTPGSPQLGSFGPNMTLAKELLEKGEKTAVLEYFDDCTKFWDSEFAKPAIDEWKAEINKGKVPNFRGNLLY